MANTIFILGTDPQQCKELREVLEHRIGGNIVTARSEDELPNITESDTVILTSEEQNTGLLYGRLLNRLQEQVHQAQFLSDLIRLLPSSLQINELLERVVAKSTEVLGDTAFIVRSTDNGHPRLEAAFSKDRDRLVKMLITTVNLGTPLFTTEQLSGVLVRREPMVIPNLQQADIGGELKSFVDNHSLVSLLAVPVQTKDLVLGALISLASGTRTFTKEDVTIASALADFIAIALENAGLIAELQRSAIIDALTGLYNTRFFHEVLGRESARAERSATPLSLLKIDIDGFKLVNDTCGHAVGNKVLTQLARILRRAVRTTDFVFRCGGDEFGVALPNANLENAALVAEKILERVASSNILGALGYSGAVTVSIGLSEYHPGSHYEILIAEADQALYDCKRSAKNCAKSFGK
jgi:diguanylate cyclase (GGDEF)-like protein